MSVTNNPTCQPQDNDVTKSHQYCLWYWIRTQLWLLFPRSIVIVLSKVNMWTSGEEALIALTVSPRPTVEAVKQSSQYVPWSALMVHACWTGRLPFTALMEAQHTNSHIVSPACHPSPTVPSLGKGGPLTFKPLHDKPCHLDLDLNL